MCANRFSSNRYVSFYHKTTPTLLWFRMCEKSTINKNIDHIYQLQGSEVDDNLTYKSLYDTIFESEDNPSIF